MSTFEYSAETFTNLFRDKRNRITLQYKEERRLTDEWFSGKGKFARWWFGYRDQVRGAINHMDSMQAKLDGIAQAADGSLTIFLDKEDAVWLKR